MIQIGNSKSRHDVELDSKVKVDLDTRIRRK